MKDEVDYINDPLGHKVCLTKALCSYHSIESKDQYDDLLMVIKNPAILIELTASQVEYFYYRSIGWQLSVLIQTQFTSDCWKAVKCTINPLDVDLIKLLQRGKQII